MIEMTRVAQILTKVLIHSVILVFIFYYLYTTRKAKDDLEKSKHRYTQLFENIYSGVTIYTKAEDEEDFIIQDMNRAGENR